MVDVKNRSFLPRNLPVVGRLGPHLPASRSQIRHQFLPVQHRSGHAKNRRLTVPLHFLT
jgi:hypothetical protein